MFNAPALNNIMINSHPHVIDQNNFQTLPMNQPLYMPMMQSSPGNGMINNIAYIPQPQNVQPSTQNFSQNLKIRPNVHYEPSSYIAPQVCVNENVHNDRSTSNSNLEEMMKDMQSKLTELLFNQNKMLVDLREKNELVQDTLACLINEVNALKQTVKSDSKGKSADVEQKLAPIHSFAPMISTETANSDSLLGQLCGPNPEFNYQLVFRNELALPLYRERNFKFTVLLTDKNGNVVKNSNRVPLTLAIYTSESSPKFVDVNTSGNKILKGTIDKDLVNGVATFDKIQIKEVTSHFRNGWVFFVVYPKTTGVVLNNFVAEANGVMVNHQQVRPLVLEKVVVKAKRSKEREQNKDIEMYQAFEMENHNLNQTFID